MKVGTILDDYEYELNRHQDIDIQDFRQNVHVNSLLPIVQTDDGRAEIAAFIGQCVQSEKTSIVEHILFCLLKMWFEQNVMDHGASFVLQTRKDILQTYFAMEDLMKGWIGQEQILPFELVMRKMEEICDEWKRYYHDSQDLLGWRLSKTEYEEQYQKIVKFRNALWFQAIQAMNANIVRLMFTVANEKAYVQDLMLAIDNEQSRNTILHCLFEQLKSDAENSKNVIRIFNVLNKLFDGKAMTYLAYQQNADGLRTMDILLFKFQAMSEKMQNQRDRR